MVNDSSMSFMLISADYDQESSCTALPKIFQVAIVLQGSASHRRCFASPDVELPRTLLKIYASFPRLIL